jgi:hypothetical protein
VLLKLLLAAFLFAHGAIHLSYLSPRPPATASGPQWPFALDRSWLLTPFGVGTEVMRLLGIALAAVTLVAFTVAAASALGIAPSAVWTPAVASGAAASIALLAVFFHPWVVLGVVIDVALLAAVLLGRWTPLTLGS